jgi:outer membrane protein assembly factor BamD
MKILSVCAAALLLLFAPAARADLYWSPETGWRAEGGVLAPLLGVEAGGRNALDLMNEARAAEEKGNRATAASLYERVAKKYPRSEFAGEALFRAGSLRLERRQYATAFAAFQRVVTDHPDTPNFNRIIGRQYDISTALIDGAHPRWWGVVPSPFANRGRGVDYAETILKNAPHSDYAPLSLMNIARAHQRAGQPEEAKDALDRLISDYPRSLLAPDAYLRLAQAYAADVQGPSYDQGATRQAITYYDDFTIQFPNDPNLPTAVKGRDDMKTVLAQGKIEIGDFYFRKRDNYLAARVLYNEAITLYPGSDVAQLARARLAEVDAAEAKAKTSGTPRKKFLGLF